MNIIFDLDGTLIDSSESILSALSMALDEYAIKLNQPLTTQLIGPPLNELLKILIPESEQAKISDITEAFKQKYDTYGYKDSRVFEQIDDMLSTLISAGHSLYILTNKRLKPTEKIIDYLNWERYFRAVYALDGVSGMKNKAQLINYVLSHHDMDKRNTIYIGDTEADMRAATTNTIDFLMVMWGYDSDPNAEYDKAETPQALLELINIRANQC